jgi:hypothetical protein
MAVIVWCAGCGAAYPSRVRARSGSDFSRLNPHLGAVLEPCPGCGSREFRGSADREWRDPARSGEGRRVAQAVASAGA